MDKLLTPEEVMEITTLKSKVSLWKKSKDPEDHFPKPYKLGCRRNRWKLSEIEEWMNDLEVG